jgi:hypothetical protein
MSKKAVISKKVMKMQPKEAEPGTAWPEHLINAEDRLRWEVSQAADIAGELSLNETFPPVGKALLGLLSDVLYSFDTHVEHPEEYMLLGERNDSLPVAVDVAADKSEKLSFQCEWVIDAIDGFDPETREALEPLRAGLEKVVKAADDLGLGAEVYPHVPEELLAIENPYVNGEVAAALRKESK